MTREQAEKHGEVIKWWVSNPDKGVLCNGYGDWRVTVTPAFSLLYDYVQNDEWSEYRTALVDGDTIQAFEHHTGEIGKWVEIDLESLLSDLQEDGLTLEDVGYKKLRIKPKIEFPIYAKATDDNYYVKFTSEITGEVIYSNSEIYKVKYMASNWVPVFKDDSWIIIDNPYELTDKCLVECWDDDGHNAQLRFYDAKNTCTFSIDGKRDCAAFDNYKCIPPWQENQEWVAEARKKLEE